jgi:hypothetical protein
MTEEIEIDGIARASADFRHLLADLTGIEHRARQRSERARGCGLGRQRPIHRPGHGRLHDGKLDLEQLDESTIRPHVRTIFSDRMPNYSHCREFCIARNCIVVMPTTR